MSDFSGKTVLVVEDDMALAGFVLEALKEINVDNYHASDAEKAIDYLENNDPTLIILDIGLPGKSGWQLLEIINELRLEKNIHIVVSTAFQDPANRLIGKLQKVDYYLSKPFRYQELSRIVTQLLEHGKIEMDSEQESEFDSSDDG